MVHLFLKKLKVIKIDEEIYDEDVGIKNIYN